MIGRSLDRWWLCITTVLLASLLTLGCTKEEDADTPPGDDLGTTAPSDDTDPDEGTETPTDEGTEGDEGGPSEEGKESPEAGKEATDEGKESLCSR